MKTTPPLDQPTPAFVAAPCASSKFMRASGISIALAMLPLACIGPEDLDSGESRAILFEGPEVNALLDREPDRSFLIDLNDGRSYYFDERSEAIDFSNFLFLCPSMTLPVPFEWAVAPLFESQKPGFWSVRSTELESEEPEFRSSNCVNICQNGTDCYLLCPDPPPPPAPEKPF